MSGPGGECEVGPVLGPGLGGRDLGFGWERVLLGRRV